MAIFKSSGYIVFRFVTGDPIGDSTTPFVLDDMITASNAATNIFATTLNNGGSGYAATDTFTVDGGTTLAQGTVLTVDGSGTVLTYEMDITNDGEGYSVSSANSTTATSGSGTGLTLDITQIGWGCTKQGSASYYMPWGLFSDGADTCTLFSGMLELGCNKTGIYSIYLNGGTHNWGRNARSMADTNGWTTTAFILKLREDLGSVTTNVYFRAGAYDIVNTSFIGLANYTNPTFYISTSSTSTFDNCQFNGCARVLLNSANTTIKNSTFTGSIARNIYSTGNYIWSIDLAKDSPFLNNVIRNTQRPLIGQMSVMDSTVTMSNLVIGDDLYDKTIQPRLNEAGTTNLNLIDSELPAGGTLGYGASASFESIFNINFQTSLSIISNTTDGAIKLYDKDDNLIIDDTLSSGEFEDVFTYALEELVSPNGTTTITTTVYDYQPFRLVITKTGYETLEIGNINVTDGQPTIIRATSKTTVPLLVSPDGSGHVRANPKNYGENRDILL